MYYVYRYSGQEPCRTGTPEAAWQPGEEKTVDQEIVSPYFVLVSLSNEPPATTTANVANVTPAKGKVTDG